MKFYEKIVELRIISLIIITLFVVAFIFLFWNSPPLDSSRAIAGFVCLFVSGILGTFLFIYSIVKEHYEAIVESLKNALSIMGKTTEGVERWKQNQFSTTETDSTKTQPDYKPISKSTSTNNDS